MKRQRIKKPAADLGYARDGLIFFNLGAVR